MYQCKLTLGDNKLDQSSLESTWKLLQKVHSNIIFCLENLGLWGALQVRIVIYSIYFSTSTIIWLLVVQFNNVGWLIVPHLPCSKLVKVENSYRFLNILSLPWFCFSSFLPFVILIFRAWYVTLYLGDSMSLPSHDETAITQSHNITSIFSQKIKWIDLGFKIWNDQIKQFSVM